jgi:hypothetical protein
MYLSVIENTVLIIASNVYRRFCRLYLESMFSLTKLVWYLDLIFLLSNFLVMLSDLQSLRNNTIRP